MTTQQLAPTAVNKVWNEIRSYEKEENSLKKQIWQGVLHKENKKEFTAKNEF